MIYIGIDDTDALDSGGTGRLSRGLAGLLTEAFTVGLEGVTRHQLLQDPRVPCTRKNNASCIVVRTGGSLARDIRGFAAEFIKGRAVAGSDPGLCVAMSEHMDGRVLAFGRRVQTELVTKAEALTLARAAGLILEELGGTGDGVIGALAAVGLRASGDDGRFNLLGRNNDLDAVMAVRDLVAACNLDEVQDAAGAVVGPGEVVETGGRIRPVLRRGRRILVVRRSEDARWLAAKP